MLRVQFNNQKSMQNVDFSMLSETSVKLTGEKLKLNTSGFSMYRLNGGFLGDYASCTQCTKTDDGYILEKAPPL